MNEQLIFPFAQSPSAGLTIYNGRHYRSKGRTYRPSPLTRFKIKWWSTKWKLLRAGDAALWAIVCRRYNRELKEYKQQRALIRKKKDEAIEAITNNSHP
jgi:hypothetical protein